jgi:ribosome maturation factor RimP
MSKRTAELTRAIEQALATHGFELVELRILPGGRRQCLELRIDHLDGDEAVTVGDCVKVSKVLGVDPEVVELLPERHVLEVSSPGINRPLTRPGHFRRFQGEQASVRLRQPRDGQRTFTGTIAGVDDEVVTLAHGHNEQVEIRFEEIDAAHLKVDPWKPRERH